MLNVSPEQVRFIITRARAFDEKVPPSGQDSEDDPRIVHEDYAGDATREELARSIAALNEDAQIDLVALMWIGRGDYEADDFESARAAAADTRTRHMPDYLLGTPLLGDYLEEGMAATGHATRTEIP